MRTTVPVVDDPGRIGSIGPPFVVPPPGSPGAAADAEVLRAAGLLEAGHGGRGHGDPGWFGGGGGGDGWDPEEDWGPRQHSPAVRAAALLAVVVLVMGTAGAWLSVALGAADTAFPAVAVIEGVAPPSGVAGSGTAWEVRVEVANHSGQAAETSCVVAVERQGSTGWTMVRIGRLGVGASARRTVTVRVPGGAGGAAPQASAAACGVR